MIAARATPVRTSGLAVDRGGDFNGKSGVRTPPSTLPPQLKKRGMGEKGTVVVRVNNTYTEPPLFQFLSIPPSGPYLKLRNIVRGAADGVQVMPNFLYGTYNIYNGYSRI